MSRMRQRSIRGDRLSFDGGFQEIKHLERSYCFSFWFKMELAICIKLHHVLKMFPFYVTLFQELRGEISVV